MVSTVFNWTRFSILDNFWVDQWLWFPFWGGKNIAVFYFYCFSLHHVDGSYFKAETPWNRNPEMTALRATSSSWKEPAVFYLLLQIGYWHWQALGSIIKGRQWRQQMKEHWNRSRVRAGRWNISARSGIKRGAVQGEVGQRNRAEVMLLPPVFHSWVSKIKNKTANFNLNV